MSVLAPFIVASAVQATTPLLLSALGGVLCAQAGVFNLALEGQMLVGAFAAVAISFWTHSAFAGVAGATIAGSAFSLILAYGATSLAGAAVVIGIGMNLLASALTAYLLRALFGVSGAFGDPGIVGLARIRVAMIEQLPGFGWAFGRQSPLTWLAWGLVGVTMVVLYQTPTGMRLRGVGEQPDAARALGIKVNAYRFWAILASGAFAGLGGAELALGAVTVFTEDMTAGRGWIAVVAVMLGRNNPLYTAAACLLFGFADACGIELQSRGLPYQVSDIAPYVVTLFMLAITRGRGRRRRH